MNTLRPLTLWPLILTLLFGGSILVGSILASSIPLPTVSDSPASMVFVDGSCQASGFTADCLTTTKSGGFQWNGAKSKVNLISNDSLVQLTGELDTWQANSLTRPTLSLSATLSLPSDWANIKISGWRTASGDDSGVSGCCAFSLMDSNGTHYALTGNSSAAPSSLVIPHTPGDLFTLYASTTISTWDLNSDANLLFSLSIVDPPSTFGGVGGGYPPTGPGQGSPTPEPSTALLFLFVFTATVVFGLIKPLYSVFKRFMIRRIGRGNWMVIDRQCPVHGVSFITQVRSLWDCFEIVLIAYSLRSCRTFKFRL